MKHITRMATLPLAAGLVAIAAPAAVSAQAPTGTRIHVPAEIIYVIGAIKDPDAPAPVIDEAADRDLPELPVAYEEEPVEDS